MRRVSNGEDGAVAVLVAIILVIMVGTAAFVVDIGNLMWERRMLQNSADAAALASAQSLVDGDGEDAAYGVARDYADANNGRGAHVLRPVDADPGFVVDANSVTVTARTGSYEDQGSLNSFLARVLGVDSYASRASATASWGRITRGRTIPIAFCERAWNHYAGWDDDGDFMPSGPPAHILKFGNPPSGTLPAEDTCTNPSYDPYPGGFGFLERDDECMAVTDDGQWYKGSNGQNPHQPHSPCHVTELYQLLRLIIDGEEPTAPDSEVLIPIFDAYRGSGSSGEFRIVGFGAFKLEGYYVQSGPGAGTDGNLRRYGMTPAECGAGSQSCLKGYFTDYVGLADAVDWGSGGYAATGIALTK
jgi:Flp pilus assembly protein TadG